MPLNTMQRKCSSNHDTVIIENDYSRGNNVIPFELLIVGWMLNVKMITHTFIFMEEMVNVKMTTHSCFSWQRTQYGYAVKVGE